MDIYVGNLAFTATEEDLAELLAPLGATESIKMINDRETGRFRGFAFVTFANSDEATAAIEALNGKEFLGRELRVRAAEPKPQQGAGFRSSPGGERRFNGPRGGERRPSFGGGERAPRSGGFGGERSSGFGGGERRGGGGFSRERDSGDRDERKFRNDRRQGDRRSSRREDDEF